MSLPKCARIDVGDTVSREFLKADGWREIGVCDQYDGKVQESVRGASVETRVKPILSLYNFSGRLWRDEEIPADVALEATYEFITKAMDEERLFTLRDGFGVFTRVGEELRIDLIAVQTPQRGTAEDIIRSAIHHFETEKLWAGTYTDNIPARQLYRKLGMSINCSERVFHK